MGRMVESARVDYQLQLFLFYAIADESGFFAAAARCTAVKPEIILAHTN